MFKQTALLTVRDRENRTAVATLRGRLEPVGEATLSYAGDGLPASHRGGDLVWHLHFPDEAAWRASGAWTVLDRLALDPAVAEIDAVAYPITRFGIREPALVGGVYRTLFVGVRPGTDAATSARFADELARMPDHIPEILNWAVSATVASRGEMPWTHVWEQEFANIDGLVGPYMTSPYHWGFVDRWFDDEMPEQIVPNGALRHSASVLEHSVIVAYGG